MMTTSISNNFWVPAGNVWKQGQTHLGLFIPKGFDYLLNLLHDDWVVCEGLILFNSFNDKLVK